MKVIFPFICLLVVLFSCIKKDSIDSLNKIKEQLLKTSLFVRGKNYSFHLYYNNREEVYFFEKRDDSLRLVRDSVEYKNVIGDYYLDNKLSILSVQDSMVRIMKLMDEHGIREYRTDWRYGGIDLKLYMKDGRAVYYISNMETLIPFWKDFVSNLTKTKDHWYTEKL